MRGVLILLLRMATAFFGYVLVWSQMRYWAAVVITRLLTVLPFGHSVLYWVWGGYRLGTAFLKMGFVLHFLLPWLIALLAIAHLGFLHKRGSSSLLHYRGTLGKGWFHPYYTLKDLLRASPFIGFLVGFLFYPFALSEPEMFIEANKMVRPVHIVPE